MRLVIVIKVSIFKYLPFLQVPHEVIEKLMDNKRLYNILNDPDLMSRRPTEVNRDADIPKKDTDEAEKPVTKDKKKTSNMKHSGDRHKKNTDNEKKHHHSSNKAVKDDKTPQQSSWLTKQITTDHHYFRNMTLYGHTMLYRGAMLTTPRYRLKASSLPDIYRNSMWSLGYESDDEMVSYVISIS
jgi:hypothetical protein